MGPKIEAAIAFVQNSTNPDAFAIIGDLKDASKLLSNEEGTLIRRQLDPLDSGSGSSSNSSNERGVIWRDRIIDDTKPPRLSNDPPKYG
jgi:hypothetical protein